MIQGAARPQLPPLQPQPCALVMIAGGTGIRAATRSFLAVCLFSHTRTLSLSFSLLLSPSLSLSLLLSQVSRPCCRTHETAGCSRSIICCVIRNMRLQGLCLGRGALVVRCRFF